jgi:hypothetical protein
MQPNVVFDGV